MIFVLLVAPWMLHLEDEVAAVSVDLGSVEGRAIRVEAPSVRLLPEVVSEAIEVVLPVEIEATSRRVVRLDLDVVIEGVPGHVPVVEAIAPSWECGCPEVHHQMLVLGQEVHVLSAFSAANNVAVDLPLDIVWCPLNHVIVPV